MSKKEKFNRLKIDEADCRSTGFSLESGKTGLSGEIPFAKYPRPQFKRDSFFNLNGKWDCGVLVPFPLGSEKAWSRDSRVEHGNDKILGGNDSMSLSENNVSLSGKNVSLSGRKVSLSGLTRQSVEEFSYYTTFTLPENFIKDHVLLNFGAVDQIAKVYIDDQFVGEHEGGYTPFSFDITDFLVGRNQSGTQNQTAPQNPVAPHKIRVDVTDTLDHKYPYGKQKKNRGGMWYTPVSGIWQTVWLESLPEKYIRAIKITPDLEGIVLEIDGDEDEYAVEIKSRSDGQVQTFKYKQRQNPPRTNDSGQTQKLAQQNPPLNPDEKSFYIKVENPKLWSPESPELYDIIIQGSQDKVQSYFALRTVGIGRDENGYHRLLLNGKPYFFNGVLDQGYWPQGIFLPNSERGWEKDILAMKKLGFNTLRKHIKIEPAGFYEACDRLGMIVFQDFVNNADYSFFHDTILPTVFGATSSFITGKNKLFDDRHFHKSEESRRIFKQTVTDTIRHLYNFPCICYYTIFNEGWGQFCADEMYDFVKERDSTRIIDSTSGWFKQKKTDVESDHIYFKKIKIKKADKPIVISEFGGYSLKLEPNHYFNKKQNYGYRFFKNQSELEKSIHELYDRQIKPYIKKGLCAAIYTQLSDVEDETNGFLTYDRLPKLLNQTDFLE